MTTPHRQHIVDTTPGGRALPLRHRPHPPTALHPHRPRPLRNHHPVPLPAPSNAPPSAKATPPPHCPQPHPSTSSPGSPKPTPQPSKRTEPSPPPSPEHAPKDTPGPRSATNSASPGKQPNNASNPEGVDTGLLRRPAGGHAGKTPQARRQCPGLSSPTHAAHARMPTTERGLPARRPAPLHAVARRAATVRPPAHPSPRSRPRLLPRSPRRRRWPPDESRRPGPADEPARSQRAADRIAPSTTDRRAARLRCTSFAPPTLPENVFILLVERLHRALGHLVVAADRGATSTATENPCKLSTPNSLTCNAKSSICSTSPPPHTHPWAN